MDFIPSFVNYDTIPNSLKDKMTALIILCIILILCTVYMLTPAPPTNYERKDCPEQIPVSCNSYVFYSCCLFTTMIIISYSLLTRGYLKYIPDPTENIPDPTENVANSLN